MKQITLTYYEIITLNVEINGIINPDSGQVIHEGLMGLNLSITAKYWISKLSKSLESKKKFIEAKKDELIEKYGKPAENGKFALSMYTPETMDSPEKIYSADFLAFELEFREFMKAATQIEYTPMKLSLFDKVDTTSKLSVFLKLLEP